MAKNCSMPFAVMAAACTVGLIAGTWRRRGTTDPEDYQQPVTQDPANRSTWIGIALSVALIGLLAVAVTPLAARAWPASNEDIRRHFGITVVDSVQHQGNTFLSVDERNTVRICERPNFHTLKSTEEIHCWAP